MTYHVRMLTPDGPAVEGTWTDGTVALEKFVGFVGSHGSVAGVTITLWSEVGGRRDAGATADLDAGGRPGDPPGGVSCVPEAGSRAGVSKALPRGGACDCRLRC
jgi:hypothetical protein